MSQPYEHEPAQEMAALRQRIAELEALTAQQQQQLTAYQHDVHIWQRRANNANDLLSVYDLVMERNHEAIMVVDAAGVVRFANPLMHLLLRVDTTLLSRVIHTPTTPDGRTQIACMRRDGTPGRAEMYIGEIEWNRQRARVVMLYDISSHTHIEKALRASEARLQHVLSATPLVVYSCHPAPPDYATTFISGSVAQMFGYAADDFINEPAFWSSRVHPDDAPRVLDHMRRIQQQGEYRLEYRFQHQDGTYRRVQDTLRLLCDASGQPVEMVGSMQDITHEKQLRERLLMFEAVVVNANDAVLVTEAEPINEPGPTIVYVNPAFERMTGYTAAEVQGKTPRILQGEATRRDVLDQIRAALDNWQPSRAELVNYTKDGIPFWIELDISPVADEQGWYTYWIAIQRDITERKQAETLLRLSEQRYRTLVQHLPDMAILIFDHDLRYLLAEGAALQAVGYDKASLEGNTLYEVLPFPAHAWLAERYRATLIGEMQDFEQEIQPGMHYHIQMVPLRNEQDVIVAGMVVSRDISERKQREEALRQHSEQLVNTNTELALAVRAKDEFLANMSHELRTPLNAILGLSEALTEEVYGGLSERQRSTLETIEESGRHLLSLINDILDLSKIEAGKANLQPTLVHIEELCHASLRMVRQSAQKKHIMIAEYIDQRIATLHADERRLKQILVNLLSNAVKFTPEGGKIGLEVTSEPTEGIVHFSVWDTGIGIASEQMQRLFKPFTQINSGLDRQHSGTGLGLALVARLTEMHRGGIKVYSEVNQGSRFTVSLPGLHEQVVADQSTADAASRQPPEAAASLAARPATSEAPLILLAEDNPTTITMVAEYLQAHGYRVSMARDGLEAVERAAACPAVILMDIQMPRMDGLEAIRHIRANAKLAATPIIALTALAMPGDRERCLAVGASDYISKPVSLKMLVETIQAHLSSL